MTIATATRRQQSLTVAAADRTADAAERAVRRVWLALLAAVQSAATWHDVYRSARHVLRGLAAEITADIAADLHRTARDAHGRTVRTVAAHTSLDDRRRAFLKRLGLLEAGEGHAGLHGPPLVPMHAWVPTAAELAKLTRYFGRPIDPGAFAAAVNAIDGSMITFSVTGKVLEASTVGPGSYKAERIFRKGKDGELVVQNEKFERGTDPGLSGTEILANQVRALRQIGAARIKTYAAGVPGAPAGDRLAYNGYYTWPRLGYDGKIPADKFSELPAALKAAMGKSRSVLDLFATPGGKEWWKENGSGMDMTFDLAADSRNMQTLGAYLDERAERAKAAGDPPPPVAPPGVSGLTLPPPSPTQIDRVIHSSGWAARIAAQTRLASPDVLATQIAGGLASGQTLHQITKDIAPLVQGVQTSARRVARTESVRVAHEVQMEAYAALGDMVVGYTVNAVVGNPHSRDWHVKRSGRKYYADPGPGQDGYSKMPRPPLEAPDASERPPGTPHVAFNCLCYLTPILDV